MPNVSVNFVGRELVEMGHHIAWHPKNMVVLFNENRMMTSKLDR